MKLSFKERTLKSLIYTDKPWADMCLSSAFLILDLILLFSSTAFTVYAIVKNAVLLLLSVPFVCFFVYGVFSWKNRVIRMLSDDTFEFTTSFGRKKLYLFSDITDLKKNLNKYDRDSRILCVAHKKIFISDLAFVSDRFVARVQQALPFSQRPRM